MRLAFLGQHNIVLCLALDHWVHGGHADQIAFFCAKFNGRLTHLDRQTGETSFALCVGINAQIKFVRASKSIGQMHVNARGIDRLAVSVRYIEIDRTGAGASVNHRNIIR